MTSFSLERADVLGVQAAAVAVMAPEGDLEPALLDLGQRLEVDLAAELEAVGCDRKLGSVARIPTRGRAAAPLLVVVGLGPRDGVDGESVRRAAGAAVRSAPKDAVLALVPPRVDAVSGLPDDGEVGEAALVRAVVEGAGLAAYAYVAYRTKTHDVPSVERVAVVLAPDADPAPAAVGLRRGEAVVRAVNVARDLVNTPPADKRPPALAERMAELARAAGLAVQVHDDAFLREGSFGGLIGVGQGSSEPPRLVEVTYEPEGADGHVVLVGKGITFDSGGLSLKPTEGMTWMKADMAGAAAVVAATTVLGELGVRTKVTTFAALAENLPSGTAQRVSDVLVQRNGTTVEVMNTDAEGRLVLADAIAYGAEREPDAIIDVATLTGAQIIALGNGITGLMASDDALADALVAAGQVAGERLWRLPLPDDYVEHIKSPVADLKNIGRPREAGTIVAGLFLREFADGRPFAHLDIAGPAFSDDGDAFYTAKGGTGVAVRTLLAYLEARGGS